MILAVLVSAWLLGLALAAHTQQPVGVWLILAVIGFAGWLINRSQPNRWRLIAAGLLAFGLGAARESVTQHAVTASDLAYYNDLGSIELSGVIDDLPDVRDKDIQLRVQIDSLVVGKTNKPVSGLALVLAPPLGSYAYGDRLTIRGLPLTPPTFDTFDYQAYLANGNVYTLIDLPMITVTAHDQANPILTTMYRFKTRAQSLIDSWLPSPQSALLNGVLLGIRTELPTDIRNAFDQTGTARILAIDGAKMAIVIGLLTAVFSQIKRRWLSVGLIVGCVLVYTLFVGAQVSVVRAATMGILAILALQLGRDYNGLSGLAFALWLQTIISPGAINEAALWISASATAGLVITGDPVKKMVDSWLEKRFTVSTVKFIGSFLGESIVVTLIVTVAALPVMLLTFGQISWFGIVINILITPAQGLILIMGLPAVLFGSILAPIGQILAWLSALPLMYTLAIVRAAAQIPGISTTVTMTPTAVAFAYMAMFGLWRWADQSSETRHKWITRLKGTFNTPIVMLVGGGIAALLWIIALERPNGQLHVWFLDVGGNAVLVESPGGDFILIDGGQNPTRLAAALGDRLPFNQRSLDTLIITQAKTADIAALPAIMNRYTVRSVLSNDQTENADLQAIISAAKAAGASLLTVGTGYTLTTADGMQITVLNPSQPSDSKTKPDEAALVLRLSYRDVSFILMSDLAALTESQMIRTQYIRGAVLQLPTHGADAVNPPDFLKAVAPQAAVIEVDSGNRAALPAPTTLQRLASIPVFRTDEHGTLAFVSDGKHLWLSLER